MPRGTAPSREPPPRTGAAHPIHHGLGKPRRRLANTRRAARELIDQLLGRADRGLPR